MNLFSIVAPVVSVVSARETITIISNQGYTTNPDGTRTPKQAVPVQVLASVQELSQGDIYYVEGMSQSAEKLTIYLPGNWEGTLRADQSGGDIIIRADGSKYYVIGVPENWGGSTGWTKCVMVRQVS